MQEGVCLCDRHQCHTQPLSSVILLARPGAMLLSRTSRPFSPCQRFMTYEIGNFSRLDRFQLFLYGFSFLYFCILCKDLSSSWAHLKCLFLFPLLPNMEYYLLILKATNHGVWAVLLSTCGRWRTTSGYTVLVWCKSANFLCIFNQDLLP